MKPSTNAAEVPSLERHPKLYLDDGDVVLQARMPSEDGRGQRYQLFCVPKAMLSVASVAFANLFADASANLGPTYDDKPLVNMEDEATEVSHLLSYLCDSSQYLLPASHPDTPLTLMGAARLADKYVMPSIHAAMVRRVTMDWPTTLTQWDIRQANVHTSTSIDPNTPVVMPEPVSAINFAHAHNCPEILPAAFYRLTSIDVDNDWNLMVQSPHPSSELFARWSLCTSEDLLRYIRGMKALAGHHASVYTRLRSGEPLDEGCRARIGKCLRVLRMLCTTDWGKMPTNDPLQALSDLSEHAAIFCSGCAARFLLWIDQERMSLWDLLADYFKLR